MQAMAKGKGAEALKQPFAGAKPMPPDSYPLWDPGKRMGSGLRAVSREEAKELSARSDRAAGEDQHLPDPVVSLVVVNPVPTDFHPDARPVRVPVNGFREDALAYFVEGGK